MGTESKIKIFRGICQMENMRENIRQILTSFIAGARLKSIEALELLNRGGANISKSQFDEMRRRDSKGRGITLAELGVLIEQWKITQRPDLPLVKND